MESFKYYLFKYVYLLVLIFLFFLFGFHEILFFDPYGMHEFRQADCLSITGNYVDNGLHFFEPGMYNLLSDGGESGKTVGEFPLLYYMVAALWSIFGKEEFIYRFLVLGITVTGCYFQYRLLFKITKLKYLSFCFTIFTVSIPLVLFYGSSFLTNMPAFSLVQIAWFFFYKYYEGRRQKFLGISFLFFTLAALLKITAFISGASIIAIFILEILRKIIYSKKLLIFDNIKFPILYFSLSLLILFSWYKLFIGFYTDLHQGKYTFNDLWPIWKMSSEEIQEAWGFFIDISFFQFLSPFGWVLFMLGWLVSIFLLFKVNKFFSALVMIMSVGVFMYLMGWFGSLLNHDYYLINLIILPLASILGWIVYIQYKTPRYFLSLQAKSIVIFFTVFSVVYGANNIRMRYMDQLTHWKGFSQVFAGNLETGYWDWIVNHSDVKKFRGAEGYIETIGIGKEDKLICISDVSFCIQLWALKRQGWTQMNISNDHYLFKEKVELGAKYLVVSKEEDLNLPVLSGYLEDQIGYYNGIYFYKL